MAIDGSKFRAANSKRNNYNVKKLVRNIKYIDEKINKYMQELDEGDAAETCDRKPDAKEIRKRIQELRNRQDIEGLSYFDSNILGSGRGLLLAI